MSKRTFQWFHFGVLTGLGVLGVVAVFPFVLAAFAEKLAKISVPLPMLFALQVLQGAAFIAGATALGLFLSRKVGLSLPLLDALEVRQGAGAVFKRILPMALLGGGIAFVIVLLVQPVFKSFLPASLTQSRPHIAAWKGLLASLYGGIDEEVLMRLFLMSLIAWLLALKWHSANGVPRKGVLLAANLVAALLFGAGHLPGVASVTTLTPAIIVMVVTLNAAGGVIFGYLYALRGLEAAMIGHLSADILLHFVRPIVSGS